MHSGSDWNEDDLEKLKIQFESTPIDVFLAKLGFETMSDKAEQVIRELEPMNEDISNRFETVFRTEENSALLQMPLVKATYFVHKYSDHESVVDCLVQTLFSRLGYNDGWLFTFPQFNLPLVYGDVQSSKVRAKADLLVLDVLSFFCMSVVEDKRLQAEVVNSEPQMVAEAIACSQSNVVRSKKRKLSETAAYTNLGDEKKHEASCKQELLDDDGNVYGVRVNGFWWYFYVIPVSDILLTSMNSKLSPAVPTTIYRCVHNQLEEPIFNWRSKEDRKNIITILDAMRQCLVRKAAASLQRRPSLSPARKSVTKSSLVAHT